VSKPTNEEQIYDLMALI